MHAPMERGLLFRLMTGRKNYSAVPIELLTAQVLSIRVLCGEFEYSICTGCT